MPAIRIWTFSPFPSTIEMFGRKNMSEYDPLPVMDELDAALKEHGFENSSDEDLQRFVVAMCHVFIKNDAVRERYMMRGITLNHIQMARMIRHIEASNKKTQTLVIVLAVVAIGVGVLQVIVDLLGLCIGS